MAIQLMQENGEYNIIVKHFLVDSIDDLSDLENEYECSIGDKVELPDGTIYIRHSDDYQGDLWELNENTSINKILPPININDDGKLLGIVENNWSIVDKPKELPNVGESDVGKTLMVQSIATGSTVIVPFQMVEVEDISQGVELIDIEDSYIEEGIDCFVEVDEIEYSLTIDNDLYLKWNGNDGYIDFNTGYIYFDSIGEHFIKVSLLSSKYEWEKVEIPTELPEVDSNDDGDVLTVVNGAWDKTALSGLPAVTSADNGKGLSVQRMPVAGAVIVPEQTAVYDNIFEAWPLANCNTELFTEGATILLTIDDHSEVCTVFAEDGNIWASFSDNRSGIGYYDSVMYAWSEDSLDPLSVSCTLASYTYEWAADPYAGYDLVMVGNSGSPFPDGNVLDDITIVKGNIETVTAKVRAGDVVRGIMYWVVNDSYFGTFVMDGFYIDDSYQVVIFNGVYCFNSGSRIYYVSCGYDESYALTSAYGSYYEITTK